jgi:transcriptional regulator with XRE-family HTH domain
VKRPRNIVGPIIRDLRERENLTQPMLVAKLNLGGWDISRETLAKIETQIRWVADSELLQLADALDVDAGEILKRAKVRARMSSPRKIRN